MSELHQRLEDGSFQLVREAAFENPAQAHGFFDAQYTPGGSRVIVAGAGGATPAGGVLVDEERHVLYAVEHNVQFGTPLRSSFPKGSAPDISTTKGPDGLEEAASLQRGASDPKQGSKAASKDTAKRDSEPAPTAPTGGGPIEDPDKESDLETLTKLFNKSEETESSAAEARQ